MFAISGMMRFDPSEHDEVFEVLAKLTSTSRNDQGCVAYWFAEDVVDAGTFRFFESWEDDTTFDGHCATPHYLDFSQRFLPRLKAVEATRYDVSGTTKLA